MARQALHRTRHRAAAPETATTSPFQQEVAGVLSTFDRHYPEVNVGPYSVDFARAGRLRLPPDLDPKEDMVRHCVVVETDGPSHFYRGTQEYTALSKLKHDVLTGLGMTVVHVPYFEWSQTDDRRAYLHDLLTAAEKNAVRQQEA